MSTVIVIYILLLVIFLVISSLILRHAVKFSYLSQRFKYIVGFFVLVALTVISFSVFLLLKMDGGSVSLPGSSSSSLSPPNGNTGSLNF